MLEIDGVQVGYGRSLVLHGVSLSVPDGGVAAVMGHNGAGKSTLLRAAIGLLKPRGGRVLFAGEDVTRLAPHERVARGMAYVPQGQQSFPHLTTAENLQLIADSRPNGKVAMADALELFPALRSLMGRRAGLLSGGQRQQLAIARALITSPRLLLLDEPTEGIQPSIILEIEDAIADLKHSGMSILLVEQYVDFAMRLADTYAVMDVGRIVAAGPTATFERKRMQQLMSV